MNTAQIIQFLTKGVTGGLALFVIIKIADMVAPKVGVGKSWLTSTTGKGIAFKVGVGFGLLTLIPLVNRFVSSAASRLPAA